MLSTPLFQITDLVCAYNPSKAVLKVESLQIPRGKLMVLLGKSGTGKSTLLETLGLMNNTIVQGDVIYYPDENEQSSVSYSVMWKPGNRKILSSVRRHNFSFIFQNTNLMPNFSAQENACLTRLIHGYSYSEALHEVQELFQDLSLGDIDEKKMAVTLSGGQKQRLAFVRALTNGFNVLFGDEPTGNLDEINSEELMSKLRQRIPGENFIGNDSAKSPRQKSAIIVSHGITLSIQYADIIILITAPNGQNGLSEIRQENLFQRLPGTKDWLDYQEKIVNNISFRIRQILY